VAQGKLNAQGRFEADEVLAKHDENYMPPEAAEAMERAKAARAATAAQNPATVAKESP
jgi:cytochrome c-type biogenesis protein CcmE